MKPKQTTQEAIESVKQHIILSKSFIIRFGMVQNTDEAVYI